MKRLALEQLNRWGKKTERLPLLLRGARQVGKTWLVREYGKSASSFVELNLDSHPEYHSIFSECYGKPAELISALSLVSGKKISPGETLLFLDEVQECKHALMALRYIKEDLPQLQVIAAGSLLEFALKEQSFPVGRIESLYLFPMNFEEYLQASGQSDLQAAAIQSGPRNPLPSSVHNKLLEEVARYSLLGGMPQVIKTYLATKDFSEAQEIQQILITSFRSDFHKYASLAVVEHIKKIFDSVPRLLGKKFKFSQVSKEIRSRELSKGLHLLAEAGLLYCVYHSSSNGSPLSAEADLEKFKVFFLDSGLCYRILGLSLSQLFLEKKQLLINRGVLAEQWVAQELISRTQKNHMPSLHYWHRESKSAQAEVDFVIERHGRIIPIEVKSGISGAMKSLHIFMNEKQSSLAYKISSFPASQSSLGESRIETVPFYSVGTI